MTMTSPHGVDFHADLTYFDAGATRLDVVHYQTESPVHPHDKGTLARIGAHCAEQDVWVDLDERDAVAFCEGVLQGFENAGPHWQGLPPLPLHEQGVALQQASEMAVSECSGLEYYQQVATQLGHLGYMVARRT